MKVGDLVRANSRASRLLEFTPHGLGCVTKVVGHKGPRSQGNEIVYVTWYDTGYTKPISTHWLEVLDEVGS